MKLNSALLYVSDLLKTQEFYTKIGATVTVLDDKSISVDIGGFELQCFDQMKVMFAGDANIKGKGIGVFFYIVVDDIDATFESFVQKGVKTSTEPKDWEWGNREFVVKDPDGYKFVFYNKITEPRVV
jgi:uncharacterized glyoxalase superfamily protein PhnB